MRIHPESPSAQQRPVATACTDHVIGAMGSHMVLSSQWPEVRKNLERGVAYYDQNQRRLELPVLPTFTPHAYCLNCGVPQPLDRISDEVSATYRCALSVPTAEPFTRQAFTAWAFNPTGAPQGAAAR